MARPLEGIRVLDLTGALSGPFGAMVLADLGAGVIKVQRRLSGDIVRSGGPFVDGLSAYFFSMNRGKKSITLDVISSVLGLSEEDLDALEEREVVYGFANEAGQQLTAFL